MSSNVDNIQAIADAIDSDYTSRNTEVLPKTTVLFNEGFAIATQVTGKTVPIPLPTILQKDAEYLLEVFNPSTISDMQVEIYNMSEFNDPELSPGVTGYASDREVLLASVIIPKKTMAAATPAYVDTSADCHGRLLKGLCLDASSKLRIKNLTQISAKQIQTMAVVGTMGGSDTVLMTIPNAAGVVKSSLYAQQKQTVTVGGTAMEAGDTWKINVLGADGVTTFTSDALAYNISANDLKTAVEALLAAAGWSRSNLGVTATTITASGAFANGVIITFTAGTTGTSMIPVFTASDISREGATIVFAQTSTPIAYNADVATLKAAYKALLELAGWTTSAGAAIDLTFSNVLANNVTITYEAMVSTIVPVPTITCSDTAKTIMLRTTTWGATPVSCKLVAV